MNNLEIINSINGIVNPYWISEMSLSLSRLKNRDKIRLFFKRTSKYRYYSNDIMIDIDDETSEYESTINQIMTLNDPRIKTAQIMNFIGLGLYLCVDLDE
jgi:hypothetical protein